MNVISSQAQVKFTLTNKWGTASKSLTVTVLPKSGGSPALTPSFTFEPPVPVTGQQVHFSDQSTGAIKRWRWDFGDGSPRVYEQNPTHTFTVATRRNVELMIANEFGQAQVVLHAVD